MSETSPSSVADGIGHFRAHGRRSVQLVVVVRGELREWECAATVVDISLAGAGIETEEPLLHGARISVAFATPTRWDPLVVPATVVWAHPSRPRGDLDALGRHRSSARSGLAFDYPDPESTLAMLDMLSAIGF